MPLRLVDENSQSEHHAKQQPLHIADSPCPKCACQTLVILSRRHHNDTVECMGRDCDYVGPNGGDVVDDYFLKAA